LSFGPVESTGDCGRLLSTAELSANFYPRLTEKNDPLPPVFKVPPGFTHDQAFRPEADPAPKMNARSRKGEQDNMDHVSSLNQQSNFESHSQHDKVWRADVPHESGLVLHGLSLQMDQTSLN
jgi:hypothetical protein